MAESTVNTEDKPEGSSPVTGLAGLPRAVKAAQSLNPEQGDDDAPGPFLKQEGEAVSDNRPEISTFDGFAAAWDSLEF